MHRAESLLATVMAGLLVASGCGDHSTAGIDHSVHTEPVASEAPATSQEPTAEPLPAASVEPIEPIKPKKPTKPKEIPKPPLPSEVEKAIKKLKQLGATIDQPKRADGTLEPVRGVFLINNNRNAREAMKHVARLPSIKLLHITGESVGDADLFYLLPLVNLESLKLKKTKVTSVGLAYLKNAHKLTYLNLINTKIDDSGVKYLYHLKNLKMLRIGGTDISREAGEELMKRIPNLTVR